MVIFPAQVGLDEELTIGLLRVKGQFFNPWYHDALIYAAWSLMLGILLLWFYYRANDASVFGNLGFLWVAQAVVLAAFFTNKYPLTFGMLLEGAVVLGILCNLNTLVAVAVVQKISYFGVEETYITEEDGSVRRSYLYAQAVLLLFLCHLLFSGPAAFWHASLRHNHILYWVSFFLAAAMMGTWSYRTLPWKPLGEVAILGEERPPMELQQIFRMPGPASRAEVVLVSLTVFLVYTAVLFVAKKDHHPSDYLALVAISLIAFNIIRAELFRSAEVEELELPQPKRSAWY